MIGKGRYCGSPSKRGWLLGLKGSRNRKKLENYNNNSNN